MSPSSGLPRITPLEPGERSSRQQELLEGPIALPSDLNLFPTLVRAPGLFRRWLPFAGKLLSGTIPGRDRELLILRTAWNCRADYEWGHHVAIGLESGLTRDEVDRVPRGPDAGWPAADALLLRAADELHLEQELSDATWKELATRYETEQLIELPMLVGHYHLLAMTLKSLGTELEPGYEDLPT